MAIASHLSSSHYTPQNGNPQISIPYPDIHSGPFTYTHSTRLLFSCNLIRIECELKRNETQIRMPNLCPEYHVPVGRDNFFHDRQQTCRRGPVLPGLYLLTNEDIRIVRRPCQRCAYGRLNCNAIPEQEKRIIYLFGVWREQKVIYVYEFILVKIAIVAIYIMCNVAQAMSRECTAFIIHTVCLITDPFWAIWEQKKL